MTDLPSAGPQGWAFLAWGSVPLLLMLAMSLLPVGSHAGGLAPSCLSAPYPIRCALLLMTLAVEGLFPRLQVIFGVSCSIWRCLGLSLAGGEHRLFPHLLLSHLPSLQTTTVFDLQENWGDTRKFPIFHTQFPLLLTFYISIVPVLQLTNQY